MVEHIRLGVNVDHVATLRNARGGIHPDPVEAARLAARAGADGVTAHLREDRRHIRDADMRLLKDVGLPLNFEMAPTDEMFGIASEILPQACCLVPEKRQELTTEGGLAVHAGMNHLKAYVARLQDQGIRVSLFIDPESREVEAARMVGADIVELHAGPYTKATGAERQRELARIQQAAALALRLGLECHAGHGLNFETVEAVSAIPNVVELNIGHFIIGEAIFQGLEPVIRQMRSLMDAGRRSIR
ncbi:pyridoxine 5'-phosphate synthase [Emcibacter sp. SYSU 3D8]|uniref:pyridoxine 5'-phosphate synthase n=1 Tax=Emcibacter sp. SYSU 3D8 TaxID=3133969 RepID=UPI0031FED43F